MSKPLPQTQHMRPGGIQDANSSNEHQRQVDRIPEDSVLGETPAAARVTRANATKLRRVSGKAASLLSKLGDAKELMIAPGSPFTSVAFVTSLTDSIKTLQQDREDIELFFNNHKKDDGTAMNLRTRVQDHVSAAEYKLTFVATLTHNHESNNSFLKEILGNDDDDVKFMIRVR